MPSQDGRLTTQERVFAEQMAATGDAHYAAQKAGYSSPAKRASQNLQKPAVCAEIAALCQAELHNDLRPLANGRLRRILENDDVAPQHHIAAAKVVLNEVAKYVDPSSGKAVSEMTPAELQEAIKALGRLIAKEEAETIEPIEAPDEGVFG